MTHRHSSVRRAAGLVAASALAASGLAALTTAPASAAVDASPGTAGSAWLADQLTDGLVVNDQFSFTDLGLSIDVGLALDEFGDTETVALIGKALADQVTTYYSYPVAEGKVHVTAGSLAKAAVFASVSGNDPEAFGGQNLVDQLSDRVSTDPASAGRISDVFFPEEQFESDFSNTIGQSFAVAALDEAGSDLTDSATDFLAAQQCEEGFFRSALGDTLAADCDADPAAAGSTDTTALVVLNLLSQTDDTDVQTIVDDAADWLRSTQATNGSWGGEAPTEAPNANSTGLAAWALGELGLTAPAEKGAAYVRALQADDVAPCTTKLTTEAGSIAYDGAAKTTARGAGITVEVQDQFRRATAQALPALKWAPEATGTTVLPAPARYVNGGSTVRVPVGGVAPGDTVCAARAGVSAFSEGDQDGVARVPVRIPEKTGSFSFTLNTDEPLGQVTFEALGATKLPFSFKKTVRRGGRQVVVVRGLAVGESARVIVGKTVKNGEANKAGKFRVVANVGNRAGKVRVVVRGAFNDRRSAQTFRVLRKR
ncbi:MAG: hypothetical protein WB767_01150 [Nocardioides sp.]